MQYENYRKIEALAQDFYKGYEYLVVSYGTHPCAYVIIPEGHPLTKVADYDDVDVNCHGGCTYLDWGLGDFISQEHKVIGWDYLHLGDFNGCSSLFSKKWTKKWTTEEIIGECEHVIEQLYVLEHPELYYE